MEQLVFFHPCETTSNSLNFNLFESIVISVNFSHLKPLEVDSLQDYKVSP
jgi:hypothetical protein